MQCAEYAGSACAEFYGDGLEEMLSLTMLTMQNGRCLLFVAVVFLLETERSGIGSFFCSYLVNIFEV